MSKIYEDANEQHVRAVLIYKKASETKAYVDAACTTQYTTSELKNVFIKGALIALEDGSYAKAVGYSETESVGSVTYVTVNNSTVAVASLAAVADPS